MRFDNVLPWFYGPVRFNAISIPRGVYSSILQRVRRSELVRSNVSPFEADFDQAYMLVSSPHVQVG